MEASCIFHKNIVHKYARILFSLVQLQGFNNSTNKLVAIKVYNLINYTNQDQELKPFILLVIIHEITRCCSHPDISYSQNQSYPNSANKRPYRSLAYYGLNQVLPHIPHQKTLPVEHSQCYY